MRYLLALVFFVGVAHAKPLDDQGLQRLEQLSEEFAIDIATLQQATEQATYQQSIIDAITRPWESRPWHQYRNLFLTEERLAAGLAFWEEHQQTLEKAEQEFQVPAEIIVAIIGVETYYGRHTGRYKVLDALYTLGFFYPKRSEFFSKEFAHYLNLVEQQGWELDYMKGSYAGAMGLGQFIPSSYLHYGVDFSDTGKVDMLNDKVDAIGSVANYFRQHRWRYGEPVVHLVSLSDEQAEPWLSKGLELPHQAQQLAEAGVAEAGELPDDAKVKLLGLEQADHTEYWLVRDNFYVITRYNRSPLYAMAVHQFSQQLKQARNDS
ncbi:lytic murein transglycosylase B [Aliagarivorans marinus]|uniref:lytic murein transglycosylase B n=1 Tax=Aliagarivorans marinus TaxID=561965 RepID=UPI00041B9AB7|nr:lytic murein transglycosylase B [Aliagarivorans marinus]